MRVGMLYPQKTTCIEREENTVVIPVEIRLMGSEREGSPGRTEMKSQDYPMITVIQEKVRTISTI